MDESQNNYAKLKKPDKSVHVLLFHFCKTQGQELAKAQPISKIQPSALFFLFFNKFFGT